MESMKTDEFSDKAKREYATLTNLYDKYKSGSFKWQEWVNWNKLKMAQKHFSKDSHETIQELTANLLGNSEYRKDYEKYILKTFAYAGEALDRYQEYKDEKGLLDFTDQEARLHSLIESNNEVSKYLATNYDLVVVDEFQDVSPLQLSLFVKLSQLIEENLWVGDPKQSIYAFRDADPELMQGVLNVIPRENKDTLSESFRSRSSLINFANSTFSKSFTGSISEEDVIIKQASKKITGRDKNEDSLLHIPVTFLNFEKGDVLNKPKQKETLILKVIDIIKSELPVYDKSQKKYRSISYGDIAILCRTNGACSELASYFTLAGIPVSASTVGLIKEAEIIFIMSLLKLLIHKDDTLAKAEVLLYSKFDGSQESMINDRLLTNNSYAWQDDDYYVHGLNQIRNTVLYLSPVDTISKLIAYFRLPELFTSWGNVNQRLANIDALINHAQEFQESCDRTKVACTCLGFLQWINNLARANDDKTGMSSGDAIQVMTYHNSKGLEWSMVFMWDLDFSLKDNFYGVNVTKAEKFNPVEPLANRELRLTIKGFGSTTNIHAYDSLVDPSPLKIQAQQFAIEEEKRLFYVGATRTKDYLYICSYKNEYQVPDLVNPHLNLSKLNDGIYEDVFQWNDESITIKKETLQINKENALETYNSGSDRLYFKKVSGRAVHESLKIIPSALPPKPDSSINNIVEIHERISIDREGISDSELGSLLHSLMTAYGYGLDEKGLYNLVQERLSVFEWTGNVEAIELTNSIAKFYQWLNDIYNIKSFYQELPISYVADAGKIVDGVIDLCIETDNGMIIIDYKSFTTKDYNEKAYIKKALSFSGQLSCYEDMVVKAFERPVLHTFVYFILEGKLFEICEIKS